MSQEAFEEYEGDMVWPLDPSRIEDLSEADAYATLWGLATGVEMIQSIGPIGSFDGRDGNNAQREPWLSIVDANGEQCFFSMKLIDAINLFIELRDGAVLTDDDTDERAVAGVRHERLMIMLRETYARWLETEADATQVQLRATNADWQGR